MCQHIEDLCGLIFFSSIQSTSSAVHVKYCTVVDLLEDKRKEKSMDLTLIKVQTTQNDT